MNKLSILQSKLLGPNKFLDIKTGWTIKVFQKIKEGEKTRTQAFEGMVIARKHGSTASGTITVRKVTGGIGIEKVFPIYLPTIEKVEIVKKSKVRRAKIYYLRDKTAKEIRKKVKLEQAKPTHEVAEDTTTATN
ncbi:MAG: 50S ribosomal protein L19 [Candidatus Yanofskybacteria bacterium RIFOXYD1_FULL_44_17]|uniref:50S ribosomal protein L19 n=1 Tax=Candidatus Yanofskybacteria bacterium GW2011_GWE2_40_11 TaxID=1619033 RepID=A0A0G0QKK0_9BACT|nr:MAG: 50S ribosomal protein L19 [Candidatus Yanofskybacteria bacterium GW2011_GWE1_40_10]KKR40623.1 MAG: 50S ribosomal protein L19 [Candidatus Yanofskybacteria bacterium GW2011_GWE2_40_11]OGN37249.1 MAG: 50S ribosomal protein L19 [Candidatus Yanofskybacteria bacterium RIFOXYB1_FULL_44_29]OGN39076.1 MAG: 50S ribosomal protein L19 [Candidatus Yanofskybacteria bacterium RIFOXYC1_FULL_44_16]OGN39380.1 MAG: 50S ribosomal protein L19 [Candidatus Yanofskybacteria bacterium RIFOXYC2_FULL_44_13]OGN40